MDYNFKKIEKKWQAKWTKEKIYEVKENPKKDKFYCLIEFPYPSGEGLHVGHPRSYTALDIVARKHRMQGENVLYPFGWDSFGLPAENYAIKTGIHPAVATAKNIKNFTRQLKSLGLSFDWSREINTTDPEYYKWTQWMFLQFFKHGLAYKDKIAINWCTKCKIGLANEEVVNGVCERCGGTVIKKMKEQWMLKITKYAERLLEGLKKVDYAPRIKEGQINWIGKSEGAEMEFGIKNSELRIKVFTTRPDTLFGATYMVLAPEHEMVQKLKSKITNWDEVEKYIGEAKRKSDLERTELQKEKTGVELRGIKAINPVNNEEIPIWVADYVLTGYGTGAIMAVPAHDERDFAFAKKFGLPIREVVRSEKTSIKNCLLIHGSPRRDKSKEPDYIPENKKGWLGWLTEKLEDSGIKVCHPQMPTPWQPRHNDWEKEVNNLDIGESSVLIGTSAGGAFLVRWMGEKKIKVKKIILVAPLKVAREGDERVKDLYDFEINPAIKNLAEEIVIFVSNDDERHLKAAEIYKKELGAKIIRLENRGHFTLRDMGTREFPEILEEILSPESFVGEGIAVNSDFLDGLLTAEAKEKIIKWLEDKKIGKRAVNYKLRDWVFSRQRYWGEPIPLVYCENCAKKKQKVLLVHGFEGSGEGNWLPWLKKELEARGFEVFNPTISTSEHPTIESWMKELLPFAEKMGEDDIIVGHSLGSKAALHLIEKFKKKIGHLFLIASAIGSVEERDWNWFKEELKDSDIDALRKFWESPVKWEIVDKLVGSKNLVLSDDDPYIKKEMYKNLPAGWSYQLWSGFGHFDMEKSPEILDLILTAKNTGWVPVPEKDLPVELPKVKKYELTETGESPLAAIDKWVKTKCPKCGGPARRETDTMPNWAGSSWYFLRYADPKNKKEFAAGKNLKYWLTACPAGQDKCDKIGGVDWYNGGMEHTTLHLLYSRFWYKFLYDIGAVPKECGDEPYKKRTSHGLILGEGGEKMSKSRGNVVNPDDVVARFGADTLRIYEMFMGPFEQAIPWDEKGVVGVFRFLERVWRLEDKVGGEKTSREIEKILHQTIKKVGEDIEAMKFNTAVSQMMILTNAMSGEEKISPDVWKLFLKILAPFAPHLAEELWEKIRNKKSIHLEKWPEYDPRLVAEEEIDLIIQINGKLRDSIRVKADINEEEAKKVATGSEKIKKWIEGKEIKKIIFVKGKLVNIVV
jgi:leucyl-tRNA synthetase